MSKKERIIGTIVILAVIALTLCLWADKFSRCLSYNNNDIYYCALQK